MAPRAVPFGVSLGLHAAALAWVAAGPVRNVTERPRTLYEQVIAPNEKKIVWYTNRDTLPEVSPLERRGISQAPKAEVKAPQTVVARPPQGPRARQMVWLAAPQLQLKAEYRSPNLLAFHAPSAPLLPPPKPKLFAPPPDRPPEAVPAPVLAAPPQLAAARAGAVPAVLSQPAVPARPQPRRFEPPQATAVAPTPAPSVAAPPGLAARLTTAAPAVLGQPAVPARPQPRRFELPQATAVAPTPAPSVAAPPQLAASGISGPLSAAVVGLNPAERLTAPPEGARDAQFSAGPALRTRGGAGEPVESARVFVPDLMVRGPREAPAAGPLLVSRTAPTSTENLRLATRAVANHPTPAPTPGAIARPAPAPDPYLDGRAVYTMAVQMPNITSYSGSWIVWFAERGAPRGAASAVNAPVPLRKVDPKYVASAAADRVEGKVRLAAVIRRDGSVDTVVLLSRLDERLDRSASEALGKWLFEPARRAGSPVEVDAVFEVPFRLAPRVAR
ncbi:MAG TPA: TonB family protein [Bryobacteraceae bacterium]|nr:TonB family protein [Bryobacteraceae bacterium]